MRVLKVIPLLLIAVMLTSASSVRAKTVPGDRIADDNGNCKDKGLHKGNDKGRCGPSCQDACDTTAADSRASCLATYDVTVNCPPDDAVCISDYSSLRSGCLADADFTHAQCVAACSQAAP